MTKTQQVAVGAAILNDHDQVLFVKRSASESFMPGMWELPGGGSEWGEDPKDALKREIMEECGIEIAVHHPLTTAHYVMKEDGKEIHRVEIIFACTTIIGLEQEVKLSEEHDDFAWVPLKESLSRLEMSEFMQNVVKGCFDQM